MRQTGGMIWRVQKQIPEDRNFVYDKNDFKWGKMDYLIKYFETSSYLLELDLYLSFHKN